MALAVLFSQAWLWLVAWQVAWLVPTPQENVGQVRIESNGGAQQIEVRVQAQPGPLRRMGAWLLVTLLLLAELVVLGLVVINWPF